MDSIKASYVELVFCKHNLEAQVEKEGGVTKVHDPNRDIREAIDSIELFWSMTLQTYKALNKQRELIYFLSACANTDDQRFCELLKSRFGGDHTEAFKKSKLAMKSNVQNVKKMLLGVKEIMSGLAADMSMVYQELNKWRTEWRREEVAKAPKTCTDIIPFLLNLTRTEWPSSEAVAEMDYKGPTREKASKEILELIQGFYGKGSESGLAGAMNQVELAKFIDLIKSCQTMPAQKNSQGESLAAEP